MPFITALARAAGGVLEAWPLRSPASQCPRRARNYAVPSFRFRENTGNFYVLSLRFAFDWFAADCILQSGLRVSSFVGGEVRPSALAGQSRLPWGNPFTILGVAPPLPAERGWHPPGTSLSSLLLRGRSARPV